MEIYKSDQSPVIYANGMPVPTGGPILTHEQVSNSLKASLVEGYDGPDPKKQGMSLERNTVVKWLFLRFILISLKIPIPN